MCTLLSLLVSHLQDGGCLFWRVALFDGETIENRSFLRGSVQSWGPVAASQGRTAAQGGGHILRRLEGLNFLDHCLISQGIALPAMMENRSGSEKIEMSTKGKERTVGRGGW